MKLNAVETGFMNASTAQWIPPTTTFASAPQSPAIGVVYLFTDAASPGAATGGGSALSTCRWDGNKWVGVSGGGSSAMTIQDEGVILGQRTTLNFVGAGVTATDDPNNGRTVVTIPGGSTLPAGSSGQIQWNNAGAFGASANLFWDAGNSRLGIGTTSPTELLTLTSAGSIALDGFVSRCGIFFRAGFSPHGGNNAPTDLQNLSIRTRSGPGFPSYFNGLEINGYDGLFFTTNVADRMAISPAGNVGIGNDGTGLAFSGYPQLIVGPSTNTGKTGLIMACGNATASGTAIGDFSGVNWAIAAADKRIGSFRFDIGATPDTGHMVFTNWQAGVAYERMRITPPGSVGIGTSNPPDMLSVAGAISVNPVSGDSAIYLRQGDVSKARWLRDTTGGYMSLWTQDAYPFALGVNGAISVWLANGGNVGIGTTSPQCKLTVNSPPPLGSSPPALGQSGNSLFQVISNSYGLICGVLDTGFVYLQSQRIDGSAVSYPMLLQSSGGNVGIGTTGPGYKLDVAGGDINIQSSYAYRVNGYPCPKINFYLDQTVSRALGPTYQNTYGVPMFVAVTCVINAGQFINLLTDINNPPNNVVMAQSNVGGVTITATVNGWVMPTQYYRINTGGASLTKWYEWV